MSEIDTLKRLLAQETGRQGHKLTPTARADSEQRFDLLVWRLLELGVCADEINAVISKVDPLLGRGNRVDS